VSFLDKLVRNRDREVNRIIIAAKTLRDKDDPDAAWLAYAEDAKIGFPGLAAREKSRRDAGVHTAATMIDHEGMRE